MFLWGKLADVEGRGTFGGNLGGGTNWLMAKWGIGKRNHWCGIEKEEYEGQVELGK